MKRQKSGSTAERFIDETLTLIDERGGSQGVNLREISRRVGCAHTNAYNYFSNFEELLWAAYRRALMHYGEFLVRGLDDTLTPDDYLERLITNLAAYPQEHPGRSRFVGSDPFDPTRVPADVLESVARMKRWAFDVFRACAPGLGDGRTANESCDIVLAYIDGETFNLINGRVIPGEDVRGRVVRNALRLVERLNTEEEEARPPQGPPYPRLRLEPEAAQGALTA